MKEYLDLLKAIKTDGINKKDRTGVGTRSLFGYQMRFDLSKGFPLLTTKKLHLKSIIHELLWILSGDTNIQYLRDNNVTIWDEWADKEGNLGKVYGHQWRNFGGADSTDHPYGYTWREENEGIDQISNLINDIKTNPFSRRLIVTAWNPRDISSCKLPPCHCFFHMNVRPDDNGNPEYLDCQMYQRSADVFLGVPFNTASYSLLTMMTAQATGLKAGHFIHTFGDVHIYNNHTEQVDIQLSREPRSLPTMKINPYVKNIFEFKYADFQLENYNPWPSIQAPIAV